VQFAKKTGDYSVLSNADICVLALTYALHTQAKAETEKENAEKVRGTLLPSFFNADLSP
jgi:RNA-binding protein NOB1